MATNTPNLNLRKPDDNAAAGGDDLVDVTLDIANNMDILDLVIGNADADPDSVHVRLQQVEALTEGLVKSTYTPVLTAVTTNPNLGSGGNFAQEGWYFKLNKFVIGGFYLRFGTTSPSAGSGRYMISVPFAADNGNPLRISVGDGVQNVIGVCQLRDNSVPTILVGHSAFRDVNNLMLRDSGSGSAGVTDASPWVWAADDVLTGTFAYIAA